MASKPGPTARELMSLGMFVFGMDKAAYDDLQRSRSWRHGTNERHDDRPASQYLGPGEDTITLAGLLVPELGNSYGSIETLVSMADEGDHFPLIDGMGRIFGNYRIVRIEEQFLSIMAGGIPRHVGFRIDLERGDDTPESAPA